MCADEGAVLLGVPREVRRGGADAAAAALRARVLQGVPVAHVRGVAGHDPAVPPLPAPHRRREQRARAA